MFVGHYGPAAAAGPQIKLWHGFLAVQFLDLLWAPFILTGVEQVRIAPGFTAANHLDLYHMPFSHSLPMAILWAALGGLAYARLNRAAGAAGAILIGALVFSHWILDFITHKPDLLLWFGGDKVGLGLWEHRNLSFAFELALFAGGLALYLAKTRSSGWAGRASIAVLVLAAVAAQVFGNWGPPPPSPDAAAYSALGAYAVFALLAAWVDATRRAKIP